MARCSTSWWCGIFLASSQLPSSASVSESSLSGWASPHSRTSACSSYPTLHSRLAWGSFWSNDRVWQTCMPSALSCPLALWGRRSWGRASFLSSLPGTCWSSRCKHWSARRWANCRVSASGTRLCQLCSWGTWSLLSLPPCLISWQWVLWQGYWTVIQ